MDKNDNKGFAVIDKNPPQIVFDEMLVLCGEALEDLPVRVFLVMKRFARYELGELVCNLSVVKIGKWVGRSQPQVNKAIDKLVTVGLVIKTQIERKDFGYFNVFELLNVREWWETVGREIRDVKREDKMKKSGAGLKKAREIKEIREMDEFKE